MISAFGVEHGEISKADAISDEAKAKRRAITGRAKKQAQGLWGAGAVGTAGALIARKPKLAAGIAAGTPVAVVGNAARHGPAYRKLGQPGA